MHRLRMWGCRAVRPPEDPRKYSTRLNWYDIGCEDYPDKNNMNANLTVWFGMEMFIIIRPIQFVV